MNRSPGSRWMKRTVYIMACMVVMCAVIYLLILPASSMTDSLVCGQTEHAHTEACYEMYQGGFAHVLICQPDSQTETITHMHDSFCYQDDGRLICPLEEAEHIHTASCYQDEQLCCGTITHQHDENCFTVLTESEQAMVLVCGLRVHQHKNSCWSMSEMTSRPEQTEAPEERYAAHQPDLNLYEEIPDEPAPLAVDVEDVPMLTALSSAAVELSIENGTIGNVTLSYQDYNEWIEVKNGNTGLSASASYRVEVVYQNLTVGQVKASDRQMKYGPLPDWFVTTATGSIFWEGEVVAKSEVTDGYIVITFDEEWLASHADDTALNGSFRASGRIDWRKLPDSGAIEGSFPGLDLTMRFEDDLASKYGEVDVEKSEPTVTEVNGTYYLKYQITVTSGEEEVTIPDITVKDTFTSNAGYIAGYVGITPDCISPDEPELSPFESSSIASAVQGTRSFQDGCMVWSIGDLQPGEVRTLIYYAEIRAEYISSLVSTPIRNRADLSSNDRPRDNDASTFIPQNALSLQKALMDCDVDASTGNGTLTYQLILSASADNSFTMTDLTLKDILPEELKDFLHGDENGQIVIIAESSHGDTVEYSAPYTDASFELTGISLAPGEVRTITYTIQVTNIFAARNGEIELRNTASINIGDTPLRTASNTKTLVQSAWIRKLIGTSLSQDKPISISPEDGVYHYEGNTISKTEEPPEEFTIPKGSIQYSVILNEDGRWDLSAAVMKDSFDNQYMKYTGYLQIEVFEKAAVESGTMITDRELLSQLIGTEPTKTVWLDVDGLGSFSFQPEALGLDDVDKYTFLLTYYAHTVGAENVGSFNAGNSFSISGSIGNGGTIPGNGMSMTVTSTVQGGLHYEAEKFGWYYEDDPFETDEGYNVPIWTNGTSYTSTGALYWIVKLEGTIPAHFLVRDVQGSIVPADPNGRKVSHCYDSIPVVYRAPGTHDPTSFSSFGALSQYIEEEQLTKLSGNQYNYYWNKSKPDDPDYLWELVSGQAANPLELTFQKQITLEEDEAIYIVIRGTPPARPKASYNSGTFYFNDLYAGAEGTTPSLVNTARIDYVLKNELYKQSMGAYIYDEAQDAWQDCSPASIKNRPAGWPSAAKALITGSGTYAEWLLNVNWAGTMEGSAVISDFLPEGIEFLYADIFWIGASAQPDPPVCTEIPELENSPGWEKQVQSYVYKSGVSAASAITYYNPATREIRWSLANLSKAPDYPVYNQYEVNFRIICKVTDREILLSREDRIFENRAVVDDIIETSGTVINRNGSMDKSIDMTGFSEDMISGDTLTGHLNELPFRIEINPFGEDLNDGDYLPALIDELGDKMQVIKSSISVTYADETPVKGADYNIQTSEDGRQTLIISGLPDNVKLIVSYNCRIDAPKNTSVEITNNAYWAGYPSIEHPQIHDQNFRYDLFGVVFTDRKNIMITVSKVDADLYSRALSGAVFELYEMQDGTFTEEPIASGMTGTDGKLIFSGSETNLNFNTLYCLKETKAPNGYVRNEAPHYFIIASNAEDQASQSFDEYQESYPELDIWYDSPHYTHTFRNEKGKISVEKLFLNEDGTPTAKPTSGSYRFGLFDAQGELLEVLTIEYTPEGTNYYLDDVLQTSADDELPHFTRYEPDFIYSVYELGDGGLPIGNDSPGSVNGITYHVTYYVGDAQKNTLSANNTITVSNQARPVQLPETGGRGTLLYTYGGGAVVLAALACIRKRRRAADV